MNQNQKRKVAIGAARAQLRRIGCLDCEMTIKDAEAVLDDMARSEPYLIASEWFVSASSHQWNLFAKEWEKWTRN